MKCGPYLGVQGKRLMYLDVVADDRPPEKSRNRLSPYRKGTELLRFLDLVHPVVRNRSVYLLLAKVTL